MKDFTTPEDISLRGHEYVAVKGDEIARVVTMDTSGSTGTKKRLYFTEGDLRQTVEFFRDGMRDICRPGDRVAILMGSPSPGGLGRLLEEGLTEMGALPSLLCFPADYGETARALKTLQPDTVVGLPVQVRKLALLAPELRPRTVLLSGDYVSLAAAESIERLWHTAVFSHYGLTESGLGFAVQCPLRRGQHIRCDDFEVEIVDSDTGEKLPDGVWGEIVFTTLRREAMPLHRYRTGDFSRLLPAPCPCGRPGPLLDRVLGRIEERRKPVSIYALDEALLRDDAIRDYDAGMTEDGVLRVTVEGDGEKARAILADAFPRIPAEVLTGVISPSPKKRSVRT